MAVPALAHYEFLRGPRVPAELALQEAWFPLSEAVVFRPDEARVSAKLYRSVSRARGREVDLAIAACAIVNNAFVWTLNSKDFADIPNLRLLP
jgi:predicted nucleic acid-binding protein